MGVRRFSEAGFDGLCRNGRVSRRNSTVLVAAFGAAVISLGIAEAATHVQAINRRFAGSDAVMTSGPPPAHFLVRERLVWEGADLDGDGQADIANPTGQAPRQTDAYGEGRFHAS
ncbi:MAG: hypothetical protein JWP23_445, partial [Phenylobacterium sp.]|nr:hypothetical protein [Phenylobacterium sp.]